MSIKKDSKISSEEEVGLKWDRCIADVAIKSGTCIIRIYSNKCSALKQWSTIGFCGYIVW